MYTINTYVYLALLWHEFPCRTSKNLNSSDAMESVRFAWKACQCVHRLPDTEIKMDLNDECIIGTQEETGMGNDEGTAFISRACEYDPLPTNIDLYCSPFGTAALAHVQQYIRVKFGVSRKEAKKLAKHVILEVQERCKAAEAENENESEVVDESNDNENDLSEASRRLSKTGEFEKLQERIRKSMIHENAASRRVLVTALRDMEALGKWPNQEETAADIEEEEHQLKRRIHFALPAENRGLGDQVGM